MSFPRCAASTASAPDRLDPVGLSQFVIGFGGQAQSKPVSWLTGGQAQSGLWSGRGSHPTTLTISPAAGGNLSALLTALDPDVVLTSDGGGQVPAARRPVHGADRVARFVLGITAKIRPGEQVQVINVNGAPGLGLFDSDGLTAVVSLTVSSDRIIRVDLIRAPGKLPRLGPRPRRVALRVGDDVFCWLHSRLA